MQRNIPVNGSTVGNRANMKIFSPTECTVSMSIACNNEIHYDNTPTLREHLRSKVTPDFHLIYSKKRGKSGVGTGAFVCCFVHRGSTDYLLLLQIFSGVV